MRRQIEDFTTMAGKSITEALDGLQTKLAKGAYKDVSIGSRKFTDISPAYTLERISELFGPLGIGWGYEVKDESFEMVGNTLSVTLRIDLWYMAYYGDDDLTPIRVVWEAYGGNANAGAKADRHFCWQGALTNAIGKGWSLQGFQSTIYKGEDFVMESNGDQNGGGHKEEEHPLTALYKRAADLGNTDALKRHLGGPSTFGEARAAYDGFTPAQKKEAANIAENGDQQAA